MINLVNKKSDVIELDDSIFGLEVREDILSRTVNWQLAKRRSGNHKVKQISEVVGSTAKPFNQKGGGRARQGDKKAPHMRGGGTAFGPVVRSHAHELPKKFRRLALKTALSAKRASGKLVLIEEASAKTPKTADLIKLLKVLKWGRVLVIDGNEIDKNLMLASNNIKDFDILPSLGANVYDILRHDTLVLTKNGLENLTERLK